MTSKEATKLIGKRVKYSTLFSFIERTGTVEEIRNRQVCISGDWYILRKLVITEI